MDKAYCFPNSLAHQSVLAHLLQSSIRRLQNGSGPNSGSGGGLIGRSNGNSVGLKFEVKLNEEEGNGDFDEEDDDGWEFKAAEPEQRGENENSEGQGVVEVAEVRAESSTFVNGGI
ncbi:hypothetical protein ACLB2K_045576 [Fragaria x ananassa]